MPVAEQLLIPKQEQHDAAQGYPIPGTDVATIIDGWLARYRHRGAVTQREFSDALLDIRLACTGEPEQPTKETDE